MWYLLYSFQLLDYISIIVRSEGTLFRNDYTYNHGVDGFLKYHEIPANWYDARTRCYLEGAILASPLTTKMTLVMKEMIKQCEANRIGIFTGIHSTFSKGDYRSVEGIPLKMIPHTWHGTEPNNRNDLENCIIMKSHGGFSDVSCGDTYPYVCYKNINTVKNMNYVCGTTDEQYIDYVPDTGSCYKFHLDKRNWTRAYMTCEAEGAYLIVINSQIEAAVVRDLFKQYNYTHLKGTLVFAGYHDFQERGDFLTIHGQTVQEAGYADFDVGQPDNYNNNQQCGGLVNSAKLDDIYCYELLAFICEKNPSSLVKEDVVTPCLPI